MKKLFVIIFLFLPLIYHAQDFASETRQQRDARMEWWREARFGMFIHWGLYALPAGEWNGKTTYGEWIRNNAQIPIDVYEKFVGQFNPVKFNAEEWVKAAKNSGMKYIVITSKHHDGFCLFDSKYTDYDIMSTPFKRDILKELSEACRRHGIKMCFYHSIMDWHHPDYLPRRTWETDRPTKGADFDRYVQYMKNQLKEIVTNYGDIGVLWFDGEWENTWNEKYGTELYNYVRGLQPSIIINNRVGASRSGMQGFSESGFAGDFGTPEQQIPSTGLPGVDWETCMTMNSNWGYNKNDKNWKSTKVIIQMLSDIASKGGNYLLNVGPTAEGVFPPESIELLNQIGRWMKINGESIYGTGASPFKNLEWGRCTQKNIDGGTRLYLHVFDWPAERKLILPGIYNTPVKVYLLADQNSTQLKVDRNEDALSITVPKEAPDEINSVIVMDLNGKPDINNSPEFESTNDIFIAELKVKLISDRENVEIRYTTNGTVPTSESALADGPLLLKESTKIYARCFRDGKPVSGVSEASFLKVKPVGAVDINSPEQGLEYKYYEGDWDRLPDFENLTHAAKGVISNFSLSPKKSIDYFGFEFTGFIKIPADGVYNFYTASDDGSRFYIGDSLVVDNDGKHGSLEKKGIAALARGFHPIRVVFFEKSGGEDLKVYIKSPDGSKKQIDDSILFYENK